MSIFDTVKTAAADYLNAKGFDGTKMVAGVSDLINSHGGVEGIVQHLKDNGLGNAVNSWVGSGKNIPVTAAQLQAAIGPERLNALANKLGIDPTTAANKLSEYLPALIDKLTPNGKVDSNSVTPANITTTLTSLIGK